MFWIIRNDNILDFLSYDKDSLMAFQIYSPYALKKWLFASDS